MGRIVRLELDNFKSYKGHQVIGPFNNFSCVIGPNGAGTQMRFVPGRVGITALLMCFLPIR